MPSKSPLNLFQRLLRQWDRVHPYNAAQIMKLRGRLDPTRATAAWQDAFQGLHLGRVEVGSHTYGYSTPSSSWIQQPIAHLSTSHQLTTYITTEINRPFSDPDEPPFRPFIVDDGDAYHLGVVYQHWIADSVAIRMLMREWFLHLHDPTAAGRVTVHHATAGYWKLFGPHNSNWRLLEGTLNTFRRYFRYRQAKKISSNAIDERTSAVQLQEDADGLIDRVGQYARRHGVKVNDVFVAAAVEVCQRYMPTQRRSRRTDVAVGSIVDLRQFTQSDLDNVFGIFLGFNSVVCTPQQISDWDTLLHAVATQNRLTKTNGMTQSSLIWMTVAASVGRLTNRKKLFHFYRKEMPLQAGVSNVTLNQTWARSYHPDPLLSYYRISPTGPMAPIVFTTTTLGSRLQVGVTYRHGLIGDERAAQMSLAFFARLRSLT